MIFLEPVKPGYIVRINNEEEFSELNEYLKSMGFDVFHDRSGGYRWFRIYYKPDGGVLAFKGGMETYCNSEIDYSAYIFLDFDEIKEIKTDDVMSNESLVSEFFDLMR